MIDSLAISDEKIRKLQLAWVEHENRVQAGCPDPQNHDIKVPGYTTVFRQGPDAYERYRDWFVPFFLQLQGKSASCFDELQSLLRYCEQNHPAEMDSFRDLYAEATPEFRAQWGNLFADTLWEGLSHQILVSYVRKYEVELPLHVLANLREIRTQGEFDPDLKRFRNAAGKLKKGVVVNYVKNGLKGHPCLERLVREGYIPKLRNTISHNEYSIAEGLFESLDGQLILFEEEFGQKLEALQTVQNLVLWLIKQLMHEPGDLRSCGVLGVGWMQSAEWEVTRLAVFQLAAFTELDQDGSWLSSLVFELDDGELITDYGGRIAVRGSMPDELIPILESIRDVGQVRCHITPVMPCIHENHPDFNLPEGRFCKSSECIDKMVPAEVSPQITRNDGQAQVANSRGTNLGGGDRATPSRIGTFLRSKRRPVDAPRLSVVVATRAGAPLLSAVLWDD